MLKRDVLTAFVLATLLYSVAAATVRSLSAYNEHAIFKRENAGDFGRFEQSGRFRLAQYAAKVACGVALLSMPIVVF